MNQEIHITYRVYPVDLHHSYFHKKYDLQENYEKKQWYQTFVIQEEDQTHFFQWGELNKSGTLTRGVMFGNNQDLSLSSSFNLMLSGKLSEEVNILASVSDNNIPIQPDGNTRQIQDFDQVYIKVFNDLHALTVGDFFMQHEGGYFLRFNKRLQGGLYKGTFLEKKTGKLTVETGAAFSKGKFGRNIIQGIEGNQGPYRLKGEQNEPYIVILAGTEQVYVDGRLMSRGQDNDYVIDYNMAEITFTPRVLITQNTRIIVEFQYSVQNYARSVLYTHAGWESRKTKFWCNIYNEQDARNQPIHQPLDSLQKDFLSKIGDKVDEAFYSGIKAESFSTDKILYKMIDSLGYDSVLVYSTNPDSARYKATFTYVGPNKGNYVLQEVLANGRVYKWVKPAGGIKQGDYEPIILLYAPQQLQMITMGASISHNSRFLQEVEGALSNNDPNTFSPIDNELHRGGAIRYSFLYQAGVDSSNALRPFIGYTTEWLDKRFSYIQWFRPAEFDRDWNIRGMKLKSEQWINNVFAGIKNKHYLLRYDWQTFSASSYEGMKNQIHSSYKTKQTMINLQGSYLQTKKMLNSEYYKYRINAEQKIGIIRAGLWHDVERNHHFSYTKDTLLLSSFAWKEYQSYLTTGDTLKTLIRVAYKYREDFFSDGKTLHKANYSHDYETGTILNLNHLHVFKANIIYRQLKITDTSIARSKPTRNILVRTEQNVRDKKGWISWQTYYETGAGLEAKKEVRFIEVAPGLGTHTWNDYNQNGIKELNEFEIAVFSDQANYMKVITNSNDYINVYYGNMNAMLFLKPDMLFSQKKTLVQKVSSLFSDKFTLRTENKGYDIEGVINPFSFQGRDTTMLQQNFSYLNTFFVNRNSSVFMIEYNLAAFINKNILLNGREQRDLQYNEVKIRINVNRYIFWQIRGKDAFKTSYAQFSANRNYSLHMQEAEPELTWQPGNFIRYTFTYTYQQKVNKIEYGGETASIEKAAVEFRYNMATNAMLQLKIQFLSIDFSGPTNSPAAFDILEGFNPGHNWLITAGWQRIISKNLQLNISYMARKSNNQKFIHTGNVQVRAFF